eukprot:SAG31_NODE_2158_length_6304_cov_2.589525_2_plen_704_part_00
MYEDGLVRFATQKYPTQKGAYKKKYAHITNYSIQKGRASFVESESECQGSKWSLTALRKWLREVKGVDDDAVWESMKDCCVRTILACEDRMYSMGKQAAYPTSCYEVWGFDLMLDDTLTPWVIEVNTSPSLAISGGVDKKIKQQLLIDLLNVVGFVPVDRTQHKRQARAEAAASRTTENPRTGKGSRQVLRGGPSGRQGQQEGGGSSYEMGRKNARRRVVISAASSLSRKTAETVLDGLLPDEVALLQRCEDEFSRAEVATYGLKLVYPTPNNVKMYQPLYEAPRYANTLLTAWLLSARRQKYGIAALMPGFKTGKRAKNSVAIAAALAATSMRTAQYEHAALHGFDFKRQSSRPRSACPGMATQKQNAVPMRDAEPAPALLPQPAPEPAPMPAALPPADILNLEHNKADLNNLASDLQVRKPLAYAAANRRGGSAHNRATVAAAVARRQRSGGCLRDGDETSGMEQSLYDHLLSRTQTRARVTRPVGRPGSGTKFSKGGQRTRTVGVVVSTQPPKATHLETDGGLFHSSTLLNAEVGQSKSPRSPLAVAGVRPRQLSVGSVAVGLGPRPPATRLPGDIGQTRHNSRMGATGADGMTATLPMAASGNCRKAADASQWDVAEQLAIYHRRVSAHHSQADRRIDRTAGGQRGISGAPQWQGMAIHGHPGMQDGTSHTRGVDHSRQPPSLAVRHYRELSGQYSNML